MARTMCSVKIQCIGSYDTIVWCDQCCCDNCVDHCKIREVQVHVMAWWRRDDGVMQSARINVTGLWSDRTLDYKTWCGFRVIIKSLTAQHNTHSTLTLLHSPTMSMINSYQFHTPRGDIISVLRGLRPVKHLTGNAAYPASRLVGLWSHVAADTLHWPLLDCEQHHAHWTRWKPSELLYWPGPWWPTFRNENIGLSSLGTAKRVFDQREQPLYVRHLEPGSLGSRCYGLPLRCHFPRYSIFGHNGRTTLEVD